MGKSGPTPPAAPDPVATANAQAAANSKAAQENAKYGAVDMYGPNGNVTYQRDANGVPLSQTTSLTPTNQQTLDVQNQIGLQLSNKAQDSLSGLPTDQYSMRDAPYDPRAVNTGGMSIWSKGAGDFAYDPNSYGDVSQINQGAADAVWNSGKARLDPMFAQQNDRQAQMLQDRGLPIDGQAASQTGANLARNQNEAYGQLANQSYLTGQQVAGENLQREQSLRSAAIGEALQFQNQGNSDWSNKLNTEQQLRGQIQNEDVQDRNRAFNEASIYLQGAPVYGTPNQVQTPGYQTAAGDVQGNTYASYMGKLKANEIASQSQAAMWQGLGQGALALPGGVKIATDLWKMSSKRLKIELGDANSFLEAARKLKLRHYRYRDPAHGVGDHFGPWAEDYSDLFGGPAEKIDIGTAVFVLWRAFQELADKLVSAPAVDRA